MQKEIVALILAGGQGTRLKEITYKIAKPAVFFGGRHRIIDYTLSNCHHSNVETIGVITQYEPLELITHIGNGSAWDLDIENHGLTILPPFATNDRSKWFTGTANAVYENLKYLEKHQPEHVLILSGDHIYTMDYQKMLDEHIKKGADLTISVRQVPKEEASRFGIMTLDENNKITEFNEKPEQPKGTTASMGIYIFRYDVLKRELTKDLKVHPSKHDFGKDIIPELIKSGAEVFAYNFTGYWRDVGTVKSLWQANLELLDNNFKDKWAIFTKNSTRLPQYFAPESNVRNSIVCEGAEIYGAVESSIVSTNCQVKKESSIHKAVIMPNVQIGANNHLKYCVVMANLKLPDNLIVEGTAENIILISDEYLEERGLK